MPDTTYLRQAMEAETTGLPLHMSMTRIRRRVRGLRIVRATAAGAALAVVTSAAAVSGVALFGSAQPGALQTGGAQTVSPSPSQPNCSPSLGSDDTWPLLEPVVDTGASIAGPQGRRYDVLIGLIGEPDDPMFTIAFREQDTGYTQAWDMSELPPGGHGDFAAKGRSWRFHSSQLVLGRDRVLDMGMYSGTAHRITVASAGRTSDAHIARSAATGWTYFWVERDARPLPATANVGPEPYTGPERLTIKAYDADGRKLHTVTGGFEVGNRTQNPRDHSPDPHASPTPGVPCS